MGCIIAETVKEHPYITAAEMEAQYRSVIDKAARQRQQDSSSSFFSSVRHVFAVVVETQLCTLSRLLQRLLMRPRLTLRLCTQGTIALLVVLGVILCLCLPRALANRNIAKRRRGDGKGGWIGMTQLGGRQPVAQD